VVDADVNFGDVLTLVGARENGGTKKTPSNVTGNSRCG